VRFSSAHNKGPSTPFAAGTVSCFFCRAPPGDARQRKFTVRALQWEFTVQIATVCSLSCAPTKNARQRHCVRFWANRVFPAVSAPFSKRRSAARDMAPREDDTRVGDCHLPAIAAPRLQDAAAVLDAHLEGERGGNYRRVVTGAKCFCGV
jgi:hypothetical protein